MDNPPIIKPRSPVLARLLLSLAFVFAALFALAALLWVIENWRGQRAWEKCRRELAAKGEPVDWQSLLPPPVPDDQNLAFAPLLKPLFDYERVAGRVEWRNTNDLARLDRINISLSAGGVQSSRRRGGDDRGGAPRTPNLSTGEAIDLEAWQAFYRGNPSYPQPASPRSPAADVLLALSKFDPEIQELRAAAAARPLTRSPIHYQENFSCLLAHLARFKSIASALQLRAAARLEAGQAAEAFADLRLGFRLADAPAGEPILISHLVRISLQAILMVPLRDGLVRHQWTEEQLAWFQDYFTSVNLLAEYQRCIRGERLFGIEGIELIGRGQLGDIAAEGGDFLASAGPWVPRGLLRQNQVALSRFHQDYSLPAVDPQAHRFFPEIVRHTDATFEKLKTTPYNFLVKLLVPAVSKTSLKSARQQALADCAALACALERHRLATGQLPETLDALVPRFMAKLPPDVVTGQPLKYQRSAEGRVTLYSVGADGRDDGGLVVNAKGHERGGEPPEDWVWH